MVVMRPRRHVERGFTVLEMMITVLIVGVISAIALPALLGTKRQVQSSAEVSEFFTELRVREDQWANENGSYKSTGSEGGTWFPATTSAQGQDLPVLPAEWKALKVSPPMMSDVTCSYVVVAGKKGDAAGAKATAMGFVPPNKNWYYLLARCDADDDPAVDAYFLQTSEDATIKSEEPDR
jgi:prepilin-type N-terminal cleavage/methylation domain-containing protein